MVWLYLPVEQPVLLDGGVGVDGPDQAVLWAASGLRGGAEDGRGGATVDLNVLPVIDKKRNLQNIVVIFQY